MSIDITRRDIRLWRRSSLSFTATLVAYTVLIVALYPTLAHDSAVDGLTTTYRALGAFVGATHVFATPSGWMNANLYATLLPLAGLSMTVRYGAAALTGHGCVPGEVVSPRFTREQIFAQKALAMAALALPVPLACAAATFAGHRLGVDIPASTLVRSTLLVVLMSFDFGMVALALGAWTQNRRISLAITTVMVAAAYIISCFAHGVAVVHHVRYLSPIYWSVGANQIHRGATLAGSVLLVALGLAASYAARAAMHPRHASTRT